MFEIDNKLKLTFEFVDMQFSWAFIIFNVLIRMRSPSLISSAWHKIIELFSFGIWIVMLSTFFPAWSSLWGLIPNFNRDFTHTFWFQTWTLDVKLILHPILSFTLEIVSYCGIYTFCLELSTLALRVKSPHNLLQHLIFLEIHCQIWKSIIFRKLWCCEEYRFWTNCGKNQMIWVTCADVFSETKRIE